MTNERETEIPLGPMTIDHPLWEEFMDRLYEDEGCKFQQTETSLTWTCDSTTAFPVTRRILADMGFTPDYIEQSLAYFQSHNGYCDCEIVLNVDLLKAT